LTMASASAEVTPLGRPKVLLNKISRAATPPSRKECIMSAQRGTRRVEATSWRPTVLPRSGQPGPDKFVMIRAKLLGDNAIDDDSYLAVSSTPKKFFEAALVDLTSYDPVNREMAFKTLHTLASEGSHDFTPESRYFVGECCLYGRGTTKDLERATRWFQSVLPAPWPKGLLPIPTNAMAYAQYLLGEAYEFGEHSSMKVDIQKALTWYSRAALRGHIVAALAMAEILAQSGGTRARPRNINYEYFGASQTHRLSQGGGAVGVRREGWKLAYFTDSTKNTDEIYLKARQYFKDVLELCSSAPERDTLKWDLRLSDWDRGSNTSHTPHNNQQQLQGGAGGSSMKNKNRSEDHGNGNGGNPDDWPLFRCRAYLGLAILDQEGLGKSANMPRAVKLLQSALDTVGDKHVLSLLKSSPNMSSLGDSFQSHEPQQNHDNHHHRSNNNPQPGRTMMFPSLTQEDTEQTRRKSKFIAGSTIIVFNLALCYHFGRGLQQNLNIAILLYKEFKDRGEYKGSCDPVATHRLWLNLVNELLKHCIVLLRSQQQHITKAAILLES